MHTYLIGWRMTDKKTQEVLSTGHTTVSAKSLLLAKRKYKHTHRDREVISIEPMLKMPVGTKGPVHAYRIFLAGPMDDRETTRRQFAIARQHVAAAYPNAQIFNPATDIDASDFTRQATASGLDVSHPADRRRLALAEFLKCTHVCFLSSCEEDIFCNDTLRPLALQLDIEVHNLPLIAW